MTYKCINISLNGILKSRYKQDLIKNNIIKASALTRVAYLALRKLILQKYYANTLQNFRITEDLILLCINSFKSNLIIKRVKPENQVQITNFRNLIPNFDLIFIENITQSLNYYSTTMLTAIENNIKNNYLNYIKRYLKAVWDYKNSNDKANLRKELNNVSWDIVLAKSTDAKDFKSDSKYHEFIIAKLPILNPEFLLANFGLSKDPQKYLSAMIYMNLVLESLGAKQFQFFPTQQNNIPRSFQFDTTSILLLFGDENGSKKLGSLNTREQAIWQTHFDFSSVKYNKKKYQFDNCIVTDGVKASVRFVLKGTKISKGAKLSSEQKAANKIASANIKKANLETDKNTEDLYFTDIKRTDFELDTKYVYIDPGKRSLLTMLNDRNQFLSFTNKQYLCETKRLKYQRKKQRLKQSIINDEKVLSETSCKTCVIENFDNYINLKQQLQKSLDSVYHKDIWRKLLWYTKINKMRSYNRLVERIKTFADSKNPVILLGDWGLTKQMRHFISTPNLDLKRFLMKNFELYEIDEYNTSKIIHHSQIPKVGNLNKLHPILTYQMENKRLGCINRDKNSCFNIRKIAQAHLLGQPRPECYCRTVN
jgi:hypothetical protein